MTDAAQRVADSRWRRHWEAHRCFERLFLAVGISLLLVYAAAAIHTALMSRASLWSFDELQSPPSIATEHKEQTPGGELAFNLWSRERVSAYRKAFAGEFSTPLAVLSIGRLGLKVRVFEGTDRLALNRGAGRISGTAMPGEQGNIGIAGHRDGFFRGLKNLHTGDQIELTVPRQKFIYTVDNVQLVEPGEQFKIPKGQKFNIDGQMTDAWGLKKGMKVTATKVTEAPEEVVEQHRLITGNMPPEPPADLPIIIVFVPEAAAPVPTSETMTTPSAALPKTASQLPLIGIVGAFTLMLGVGLRVIRIRAARMRA